MAALTQHRRTAAAWLVHAYTASGVVLAFLMFVAVMEGDTVRALWLFLVAMVVDGTDGMLARWVQVKRHAPSFDGALLDNIVDYITYAFMPMLLLWSAGYLGEGTPATILAVIPLVASAYQFCRVDAKTDDHLFLGFPSLLEHRSVLHRRPRPADHGRRRRPARVRGARLRPGRLRLPVPHVHAAVDHARPHLPLAGGLRRAGRPGSPTPAPCG